MGWRCRPGEARRQLCRGRTAKALQRKQILTLVKLKAGRWRAAGVIFYTHGRFQRHITPFDGVAKIQNLGRNHAAFITAAMTAVKHDPRAAQAVDGRRLGLQGQKGVDADLGNWNLDE